MVEQRVVEVAVQRMNGSARSQDRDLLAIEEPLELRLGYGTAQRRRSRSITVTMRTPGSDIELAAGFLFAEGLVQYPGDIEIIQHCGPPAGPLRLRNVVRVELQSEVDVDSTRLERNFLATSSCGICGKASLKALATLPHGRLPDGLVVPASSIHDLPEKLRQAQTVFDRTGGLHAAALFDRDADRTAISRSTGPPLGPTDLRQRTRRLRIGAEGYSSGNSHSCRCRRPVEPRGGPRKGVQHDAARLREGQSI